MIRGPGTKFREYEKHQLPAGTEPARTNGARDRGLARKKKERKRQEADGLRLALRTQRV